ncbi:unnamed protein product [Camellia sinensis]
MTVNATNMTIFSEWKMMKMGLLGIGLAGSAGLDLQHRDINNLLPGWYVDTFNKGARNQTNLFQSPSIPSIKPASGGNPKFFVPTQVSSSEQTFDTIIDSTQETTPITEIFSNPTANNSFQQMDYIQFSFYKCYNLKSQFY